MKCLVKAARALFLMLLLAGLAAPVAAESNEMYSVQNLELTHKASGKKAVLKDLFGSYPGFTKREWSEVVDAKGVRTIRFVGWLDLKPAAQKARQNFGLALKEARWEFQYTFKQKLDPKDVRTVLAAFSVHPESRVRILLENGESRTIKTNVYAELMSMILGRPISFHHDFGDQKLPPLPASGMRISLPMKK